MGNKLNWVIDSYILENGYESLVGKLPEIIKSKGHGLHVTKYVPFERKQDYGNFPLSEPIILYGTVSYVKRYGGENYAFRFGYTDDSVCSAYFPKLSHQKLLNNDYIMLPWGEFVRRKESIFKIFSSDKLFIRPNSGHKTFTGFVISFDDFEYEVNCSMQLTSVTDNTLILISSVKQIDAEYRFVIADKKVITGSEYRWENKLDIRPDYPDECYTLAQDIADLDWQLDTCYTVDVASTPYGPKVIELNSFSSAGLYACDLNKIVDAVSFAAIKEFYGDFEV